MRFEQRNQHQQRYRNGVRDYCDRDSERFSSLSAATRFQQ
jgi:hypothetical protein